MRNMDFYLLRIIFQIITYLLRTSAQCLCTLFLKTGAVEYELGRQSFTTLPLYGSSLEKLIVVFICLDLINR